MFLLKHRQRGAVLLVSLIMLIVLTLYGLSVSNNSMDQVKMTTINNDTELALAAANMAMQRAILDIEAMPALPDETLEFGKTGRGNVYLYSDPARDLTDNATWDGNSFVTQELTATVLTSTGQQARYFITYLGVYAQRTSQRNDRQLKQRGVTENFASTHNFKIIAMGQGATNTSRRIIKAFHRRTFTATAEEGE